MTDASHPQDASVDLIREARRHQAALLEHRAMSKDHQNARDRLIHDLRASDLHRWSYSKIADAVGLTSVNVVKILNKPAPEAG